jgi:hypothetical protein
VPGDRREILNYQYRNRFRVTDYRDSARLYKRIAPGLLASGHWDPRWVEEGYLDYLAYAGWDLIELHNALLPLDELDLGADGVLARIEPYRRTAEAGKTVRYAITVRNPHATPADATLRLVLPSGWTADRPVLDCRLDPNEEAELTVDVRVGRGPPRPDRGRCQHRRPAARAARGGPRHRDRYPFTRRGGLSRDRCPASRPGRSICGIDATAARTGS